MIILRILSTLIIILIIKNKHQIRIFTLIFCPIFYFRYNQFVDNFRINEIISINIYSYILLLLTYLIIGLIFIFFNVNLNDFIYYKVIIFILLLSLTLVFISINLIIFYFIFEVRLILIFLIIIKWGLGEIRKLARFYLLYYTIFFSLPFLIFVIELNKFYFIQIIYYIEILKINYLNNYLFIFFIFTLFVKIPIYILHSWLLKAHVEAPVIGSIILAGILLKLGVYGLIRFISIFILNFILFNKIILYLSIFGSIIISILCIRQVDIKILVAYSSVVHIGLILGRIITLINFRIKGRYIIIIAHGLCSSGIFFLVNLCYLIRNRRLLIMNKGLINIYPRISLIWFLLCSSNLSAPISLNLISEIILIIGLLNWNFLNLIILIIIIFFRFLYSLNLFRYTQHGEFNIFQNLKGFNLIDYLILIIHWIPLNLFIFNIVIFL